MLNFDWRSIWNLSWWKFEINCQIDFVKQITNWFKILKRLIQMQVKDKSFTIFFNENKIKLKLRSVPSNIQWSYIDLLHFSFVTLTQVYNGWSYIFFSYRFIASHDDQPLRWYPKRSNQPISRPRLILAVEILICILWRWNDNIAIILMQDKWKRAINYGHLIIQAVVMRLSSRHKSAEYLWFEVIRILAELWKLQNHILKKIPSSKI